MKYLASLIKQYLHDYINPYMTHNTKELELQLKHPVGVSLARVIPYVNQTKLLRYPHNSTTRRNQNHTDPQYKRGRAPLKNTAIKNSTSLKKSNTKKNQHNNHQYHSMKRQ